MRGKVAVCVIILAVIVFYYSRQYDNKRDKEKQQQRSPPPLRKVHQIRRIVAGEFNATEIAKWEIPVIITNSSVNDWPAIYEWKPLFIQPPPTSKLQITENKLQLNSSKFPSQIKSVSYNVEPFFTYFQAERPLSSLQGIQQLQHNVPSKLPLFNTSLFLHHVFGNNNNNNNNNNGDNHNNNNDGDNSDNNNIDGDNGGEEGGKAGYYYYSSKLKDINEELIDDIEYKEWVVEEDAFKGDWDFLLSNTKLMLWMGSKGVITRLHYDWSHNYHVLLHGKKLFHMYPPEDSWALRLYPYLHPRATKSQIILDSNRQPSDEDWYLKYPEYQRLQPLEGELQAGEVLYIPPMWFHHVQSLQPSISLAIWSPCFETMLMNEVLTLGVPLKSNWMLNSVNKTIATIHFVHSLITLSSEFGLKAYYQSKYNEMNEQQQQQQTVWPNKTGDFIRSIFQSRYYPLLEDVEELRTVEDGFYCPPAAEFWFSPNAEEIKRHIRSEVKNVYLPYFQLIPKQRRDIWLADFVEVTLHFAFGNSGLFSAFLCFGELFDAAILPPYPPL